MKEKIILIGGGGHCKVVIDAIINTGTYNIKGIIDNKMEDEVKVLGIPVIGNDVLLPELYKKGINQAFVAVGSVGDCNLRKAIYKKLKNIGFDLAIVVHHRAVVAKDVEIDEGTFIAAGAVINPGTTIGKNVIINTCASVDHDCKIGDFVHVAPGATLSGGVEVGESTHIGTGANLVQGLKIGKGCMVKAGTIVKRDLADNEVAGPGVVDQNGRIE